MSFVSFHHCSLLQYEFVTPLTSLLVIKPNQTSAETELQSADNNDFRGKYYFLIIIALLFKYYLNNLVAMV